MKRALVMAVLGGSGVFAGMMACVGSSFVETGGGGNGATGPGGSTTTSGTSTTTTSATGMTTTTTTTSTTTTSTTTTTTTTTTSSGGQGCPGSEPKAGDDCNVENPPPCGPYTSPDGCCTDDSATCTQEKWVIHRGGCIAMGVCPNDPTSLVQGADCSCYGNNTMCPIAPCMNVASMHEVAVCKSSAWQLQMAPCPVPCGTLSCTPPGEVCVMTLVGDAGTQSKCEANPCSAGNLLSCDCASGLCPNGACTLIPPDTISCL